MSPRVRSGLEVTARMKNRWPTTDTDHGGARGDHIVLSILYESCIRPITTLSTLPAASVGAVPSPLVTMSRALLKMRSGRCGSYNTNSCCFVKCLFVRVV